MKLIKHIKNLNKTVNNANELGFVPTMGSLHKGHEALIKLSKKKCKKTLVSIFVNPTQFNNKDDFRNYPRDLKKDLITLNKLKVDFVYLPTINQIYKKKLPRIFLKKSQKILCAKFRKDHFEGVLNVINRFVKLLSPKIMFMGEKDYQQYYLVNNFISKNYNTCIYLCKTIRNANGVALSSRNKLLNKNDLKTAGLIANKLIKLKRSLKYQNTPDQIVFKRNKQLLNEVNRDLTKKFNIKIDYLECRNLIDLSTKLYNRSFKLFVSYHLNNVRLIDNF